MKKFLITIDTESDNQWDYDNPISTENAKFLPRFQELCERYKFKPTWLTNYEMANDDFFCHYMKEKQDAYQIFLDAGKKEDQNFDSDNN